MHTLKQEFNQYKETPSALLFTITKIDAFVYKMMYETHFSDNFLNLRYCLSSHGRSLIY